MDDNEFSTNMDSESEEEVLPLATENTGENYSTLRNSDQNFDEQSVSDDDNEVEVRSMEDVNERVGRRGDANNQDMEEEEEEMDYTSGNDDQDNVTGTSMGGEGEMFYSCHEDFQQGRSFLDKDSMGKSGPHSPDGPPPDSTSASPGTADSGSDTGDFDYGTPSATASRGLQRRMEEEGSQDEESGGGELETPLSPVSTAEDSVDESEQFDSQGSDAQLNLDLREDEATSESRRLDDRTSSSDEDVKEFSEESVKLPTDVPYQGQEESSEELRTGDDVYSTQEDDNEPDTGGENTEGEHSVLEVIREDKNTDEDAGSSEDRADQIDFSSENIQSRTEGNDSVVQASIEYTETNQVEQTDVTARQKDNEEEDDDHLDLTVPSEKPLDIRDDDRAEAAIVDVHHIDDHGDELDFEEDVEDPTQQYQETAEEQVEEETKVDKESELVKESVEEEEVQVKDGSELSGDGEIKDDDDDDDEEGEDGELDDDDIEEGEVKETTEKRKPEVKPICRFFTRGHCTWGNNCRFIHPGINDKGNYSLIDRRELHNAQAKLLGEPLAPPSPPPKELPPPPPEEEEMEFLPPPPEEAPRPESAWERGLRHARELRKKAMQLKEKGILPAEQKTIGDMIDEENDFDKENEFIPRKGDFEEMFMPGDVGPPEPYPYPMPPEQYERQFGFREQQPSPPRQVYRVQQEFNEPRGRMNQRMQRGDWRQNNFNQRQQQQFMRQRPQQQQQPPFRRGGRSPPGGFVDKRRDNRPDAIRNPPRRDKPGMRLDRPPQPDAKPGKDKAAPDSWQDPWARNKSPGGKRGPKSSGSRRARSRSNSSASYSDRSYSSRSRSRSDSRSRSRSYSSRSRSSSRSSYSGSSRSRSRSKSAGSRSYSSFSSRSRSRSPPAKSKTGPNKPGAKPPPKPIPSTKSQGPTQSKPRGPSQTRPTARPQVTKPTPGQPPTARPSVTKAAASKPVGSKPTAAKPSASQPSGRKPAGGPGGPQTKAKPVTKPPEKQPPMRGKASFPKPVPMKRRSRSRTRSESLSSISSRSSYSSYSRSRSRSRSYSRSSSSSRSRSRSRERARPGARPGVKPGAKPGPRPGPMDPSRLGARPGTRPGDRPGARPAERLGPRPGERPGARPGGRPGPRPGERPGPGSRPGERPGPGSRPGERPGPGSRPGERPGARPPRPRSRSFSGSRSRSRSSSVSSRSSISSADSDNMYANLASPVSSASSDLSTPPPKRGIKAVKGPAKPPTVSSSVKSSGRPVKPSADSTKAPARPAHPPTKKVTKAPPTKAPTKVSSGKPPSKPPAGDRPSSSSKVQGSQRPSSTTAKPSRGPEGRPGPQEPRMKERAAPVPSSTSRQSSSQQNTLKYSAKKEIKLNLIPKQPDEGKKRPPEPSSSTRTDKKTRAPPERDHKVGSSTVKQQATSSTDVKQGSAKVSSSDRKRPSSPPPAKAQPPSKSSKTAAGAKAAPPKKESVSRREEILKQLQAVEDLIRKKKAKLK